jgi:hypothetical protein
MGIVEAKFDARVSIYFLYGLGFSIVLWNRLDMSFVDIVVPVPLKISLV